MPKGRSRRESKDPFGCEWEIYRWADKEEMFFPSFVRGGASSQNLNLWSCHEEEEDTRLDHF